MRSLRQAGLLWSAPEPIAASAFGAGCGAGPAQGRGDRPAKGLVDQAVQFYTDALADKGLSNDRRADRAHRPRRRADAPPAAPAGHRGLQSRRPALARVRARLQQPRQCAARARRPARGAEGFRSRRGAGAVLLGRLCQPCQRPVPSRQPRSRARRLYTRPSSCLRNRSRRSNGRGLVHLGGRAPARSDPRLHPRGHPRCALRRRLSQSRRRQGHHRPHG